MPADPTLKQLRYFAALARTGHYRRAAEALGISQPSLSQQIGALEDHLGLRLVDRGRGGAVLTPAGRDVLAHAHRVLAETTALTDLAEHLASGRAGTVRLGTTPTLGPYILPNTVARLHRRLPDLKLYIRDGAPRTLIQDLLDGAHDIILTPLPVASAEVTVVRLFREPLRLAAALDHPLARRGTPVTDADLAGETLLGLSPGFALHGQITALAEDTGARLRQDYEGTSLDALRQMTAMNMGLTFLPALYVHSEITEPRGDVALLPFRAGRLFRSIGVAWRRSAGTPAALSAFTDALRRTAARDFAGLVQMET